MRNDNRPKERNYSNYKEDFQRCILDNDAFSNVYCRRVLFEFPSEYSSESYLGSIYHIFSRIHFLYYPWINYLDGALDFFGMVAWVQ